MTTELRQRLDTGLEALGLALSGAQREALVAYVGLLAKWNRAYNLTAVRDPAEMVTRHLLDSLAVMPHLERRRRERAEQLKVVDVGTGPGLPGIPLAIACPAVAFWLLDSNGKKTRFVTQVKAELGLANVTVVNSRLEAYRPEAPFDVAITRAFASLYDVVEGCRRLICPRGRILAMKGAVSDEELRAVPEELSAQAVALVVPGLEQEARHLVTVGFRDGVKSR